MLPKKERVTKELFQTIMKQGRIISSPFFVFRYVYGKSPKYAFVAPKSIAKEANKRNALRRKGYNILREAKLPICSGIFFYKKPAKIAKTVEIKGDILTILSKIR